MSAILFALISYFGWAVGDIFGTIASRKLNGYTATLWGMIFRSLLFSIYIPFALKDLRALSFPIFFIILILGILWVVGVICFSEALKRGNASLVGVIVASFSAVVVVLSVIFFKEKITISQIVGIGIILIGLFLSTLDINEFKKNNVHFDFYIILAFFAMIIFGVFFAFIKIPVKQIGWFWPSYITFLTFPFVLFIMKIRNVSLKESLKPYALLNMLAAALLTGVGDFALNFALSQGLSSIVAPIAGAYPTLFVVLAFFIFKDKITHQQIVGVVITLAGIVLLAFLSV